MGPGELGRRRTWRGATSRQRLLQVLLGGTVRSQSRSRGRTHLSAHLRLSCWSPLRVTQVHGEVTSVSLPEAFPAPFRGVRVCARCHVRWEGAAGPPSVLLGAESCSDRSRWEPMGRAAGRALCTASRLRPGVRRAPSPSLPAHTCPLPVSFRLTPILTHQGPVPIPLSGESGPVVSAAGPTGRRLHTRASPRLERRGESWG